MRKKEGLSDYRYFPDHNSLPELPEIKRRRCEKMGLSMQDVLFLANDKNVSS